MVWGFGKSLEALSLELPSLPPLPALPLHPPNDNGGTALPEGEVEPALPDSLVGTPLPRKRDLCEGGISLRGFPSPNE